MKNFKQGLKIKTSWEEQILQLFLVVILVIVGELKFLDSLVLAQNNTVDIAVSEGNKLVSTTATYEDSGNPNVEINATSNDVSTKDLTINNNDLSFEDDLLYLDIFLTNSGLDILLESDF